MRKHKLGLRRVKRSERHTSSVVLAENGQTHSPSATELVIRSKRVLDPRKSKLAVKIKPTKGYAHVLHILLSGLMPALVFILVRINFAQLAVLLVLITKWRMFAMRPRFWPAIVRANAVDIMVGLATVVFMTHSNSASMQLFWAILYMVWQIFIKPGRSTISISGQAMIGQIYGLTALFIAWPAAPLFVLVFATWTICYLSARHFLSSFDEPYTSLYSHTWGYFAAGLAWLGVHWLLFYGVIAQPVLLLNVLGFGLAGLYYLQETDRLSILLRRQIVFIMVVVVIVVLVFSDWGDKTI